MASPSQYSDHLFIAESHNNSWSNMYRYVPQASRVLDVGCSTGNFGAALEALKECSVVGIDLSEADVAEAATKITEAHVLDITSDGVPERLGTFDVVVFADVLEHLMDPRAVLRTVRSMLKPGGRVVYSIPNMAHLSVRMDLLEGRFPYTELGLLDRTHMHFYDRLEVHDIFASAGFAITDSNPVLIGYPEAWITERFVGMGLTPAPPLFEMLRHTEANIYQYVGAASPADSVPQVPPVSMEFTTAPDELLAHANRVLEDNQRLDAELRRLAGELSSLQLRVAAIRRNPIRGIANEFRRRRARARR